MPNPAYFKGEIGGITRKLKDAAIYPTTEKEVRQLEEQLRKLKSEADREIMENIKLAENHAKNFVRKIRTGQDSGYNTRQMERLASNNKHIYIATKEMVPEAERALQTVKRKLGFR